MTALDLVALGSFAALALAWCILPLRAPAAAPAAEEDAAPAAVAA
jgi:hypothetical protein